jgi:hypothetical protein
VVRRRDDTSFDRTRTSTAKKTRTNGRGTNKAICVEAPPRYKQARIKKTKTEKERLLTCLFFLRSLIIISVSFYFLHSKKPSSFSLTSSVLLTFFFFIYWILRVKCVMVFFFFESIETCSYTLKKKFCTHLKCHKERTI